MAEQDQLERLRASIAESNQCAAWNQWRREDWDTEEQLYRTFVDLSGTDFKGANLNSVDFREANLICALLSGADLNDSNFRFANLTSVHFRGANLSGADLYHANLIVADLSRANLSSANLQGVNLSGADLCGANLSSADLSGAILKNANFRNALLKGTRLTQADLRQADLSSADLSNADLSGAYLTEANLTGADLINTTLVSTDLRNSSLWQADLTHANLFGADLTGCQLMYTVLTRATLDRARVHGVSVWDIQIEDAKQHNLIITSVDEPDITVDNLEMAQFIYLLLNNMRLRDAITTLTTKVVLILGRFTAERKIVLDALREHLRHRNYLPILFDFEKPYTRDFTETVTTLAHLARFVIADLTAVRSLPQELQAIVPTLAVPVQPLIHVADKEYAMFADFSKYPWVLLTYHYTDIESLLQAMETQIILPAEAKAKEREQH